MPISLWLIRKDRKPDITDREQSDRAVPSSPKELIRGVGREDRWRMIREGGVRSILHLVTNPNTITNDIPNTGINGEVRIMNVKRSNMPTEGASRVPIIKPGRRGNSITNLRNNRVSNLIPHA
jgi:hypothetical protein